MSNIQKLRELLHDNPKALELLDEVDVVPVVGEPVAWAVSIRDGTYRVTRDSLISAGCARSGCTVTPLHPAPADAIPRAWLGELPAAVKRVQELEEILAAFVEYAEACNDDSPEFYRARAALAASKREK